MDLQRVLVVLSTESGAFGGTEKLAALFARALKAAGHEAVLVAVGKPVERVTELLGDIRMHVLSGIAFSDVSLATWRDLLRSESPTIVVRSKNCVGLQSWRLDLAVRTSGARYLSWEHHIAKPIGIDPSVPAVSGVLPQLKQWAKMALHFLAPQRTVAVSQAVRNALVSYYGQKSRTIDVIYPGVDLADFQRDEGGRDLMRMSWRANEMTLVVGTFGRLVPHKGNDILIAAIAMLVREIPDADVRCVIGGIGSDLPRLRQLVVDLGVEHSVFFAGWQEYPAKFLSALDVVCLPSSDEGLGLVLIEGIASGALALARSEGGMPEIFGPLEGRCIIESADPAVWSERLKAILLMPSSERKSLSMALNTYVRETFESKKQWARMVQWVTGRTDHGVDVEPGPHPGQSKINS